MGDYKFRSAVKRLVVMGLLETKIKKANGNPTTHYKPNLEEIANRIIAISQNRFRDNRENDIAIPAKSLTDITTEITTNTPIVENEDEPAEETVFLVGVSLLKSQIHHGNPGLCLSSFTQNKNKTMRK